MFQAVSAAHEKPPLAVAAFPFIISSLFRIVTQKSETLIKGLVNNDGPLLTPPSQPEALCSKAPRLTCALMLRTSVAIPIF